MMMCFCVSFKCSQLEDHLITYKVINHIWSVYCLLGTFAVCIVCLVHLECVLFAWYIWSVYCLLGTFGVCIGFLVSLMLTL